MKCSTYSTYPKYLYPLNASKSRVLISAWTLHMYMQNRIAMISTNNQTSAELAVIPSCSGVNLNNTKHYVIHIMNGKINGNGKVNGNS
jgi:hypothetical protein